MTRLRQTDDFGNKAEAFEEADNTVLSPAEAKTFGDIVNARYGRRDVLRGVLGVSAVTALFGTTALTAAPGTARAASGSFAFAELESGNDERHHVAEGYDADVLIRWGDPLFDDVGPFDPQNQSAADQLRRFGYNNDYVGFLPLSEDGKRGLLCVNHEYTNEEVMFPGIGRQDNKDFADMTRALVDIEMAAHGGSVFEIARDDAGKWSVVTGSKYNRRISMLDTEMTVDGPAAGHARLKTAADPEGTRVIGTLNNCAGGMTPWGTYLMAEENFHGYFWTDKLNADGKPVIEGPQAASLKRYGAPGRWYNWGQHHDRFNLDKEPNEVNRFGWIVEVDPLDPASTPVKHTALGRFRHEGAEAIVNGDGRVVIYSGDDARFDYVYKFVSSGTVSDDREANKKLLSEGTLYVGRFQADGRLEWLPLVHGEGPLTAENGFESQADVLIDTRLAADALGATPMDRPEDVQPGEKGRVYMMLTNNTRRKEGQEDAANPRADNAFGHIVEMVAPQEDHAAREFTWSILVKCGDPRVAEVGAQWGPETSEHGWFASPDNCAIDAAGRLWVSTDQGSNWGKTGKSDGLYAVETEGALRGSSKLFFRCPVGGELCGPYFTPDQSALFLAVQHPGTDGTKNFKGFERNSTFEDPATRWPDFVEGMPPRPSVVVVTRKDGGKIGG
ncbi:PhoX family protein [Stappia indica]|uniref:PhoX family protein n=1 Tax=Stappia indica TaxID=538381 RepID=UPI001CD5419F|nr:PhoX family phosphatase [Stappia indica]MCA1296828.1 PhoX family phosphatase [Stappia indica]